ncbi:hypothetical protein [Shivajiella indica]|uniref:DUF3575 domain-containing protein n=1 Tax=Shivajiella indica TaxID=872115 RepID=A0ABW5B6U0_9BACT
MKRNQIFIIQVILFVSLSNFSFAQKYATALGVRLGNNDYSRMVGITAQHRIMQQLTLEGIVQSDFNRNTTFHLLMKRHRPIISKRFNYFYGGGFSAGKEESYVKQDANNEIMHTYGNSTMGVDLIGGIEMTFAGAVISLDYKPNINISGREEFYRGQIGISARMVLDKGKRQDKKWRKKNREKRRTNREPFGARIKNTFGSMGK